MRRWRPLFIGVTLHAVLMAACARADRDSTGDTAPAGRVASAGETTARSACDLLPEQELEALIGKDVDVRPGKVSRSSSKCAYFAAGQEVPYLELTVYWTGGKETWGTWAAAGGMAKSITKATEGVDLDSIVQPGPVPGLGDSAIYNSLMPSLVLKDDVLLEMMVPHLPNAKTNFRPLAQKILARI